MLGKYIDRKTAGHRRGDQQGKPTQRMVFPSSSQCSTEEGDV